MKSLRSRLLLQVAGGVAVLLLLTGAVVYWLVRATLLAEFDAALLAEATTLASMVDHEPGGVVSDIGEKKIALFEARDANAFYALRDAKDRTIDRSRSVGSHEFPRLGARVDQPVFRTESLPDGRSGRIVEVAFHPALELDVDDESASSNTIEQPAGKVLSPRVVRLSLARSTQSIDRSLSRLAWGLAGIFTGGTLLLIPMVWWLVRSSLKPLAATSAEIAAIDGQDLSLRLNASDAPAEVSGVIERLNDLLARLQAAFGREREFSANVAHELRTPLAGMRSTLEVTLSRQRDAGQYRESLGECLRMTCETEKLVGQLLSLARIDAGQLEPKFVDTNVNEELEAAWKASEPIAQSKAVSGRLELDSQVVANTDLDCLRILLRNLVDNAVAHCDPNGKIQLTTKTCHTGVQVVISNSGNRLTRGQLNRVFDRFWQGDPQRTATGTHAGLGLSLCRELANRLGLALAVDPDGGELFTVSLDLPSPSGA